MQILHKTEQRNQTTLSVKKLLILFIRAHRNRIRLKSRGKYRKPMKTIQLIKYFNRGMNFALKSPILVLTLLGNIKVTNLKNLSQVRLLNVLILVKCKKMRDLKRVNLLKQFYTDLQIFLVVKEIVACHLKFLLRNMRPLFRKQYFLLNKHQQT